jgi:hypothetical protein
MLEVLKGREPDKALDRLEPLLKVPYYSRPTGSRSTAPSPRLGATRASSNWLPAADRVVVGYGRPKMSRLGATGQCATEGRDG